MAPAAIAPPKASGWGIQVGAYSTRAATEQAIKQAIRRAPALLQHASGSIVAIVNKHHQQMFRARLTGLAANDARKACQLLAHCRTLPPGT